MNYIPERRCTNCIEKEKNCSIWEEKEETTSSEWDKNRAATLCCEYKIEKTGGRNE